MSEQIIAYCGLVCTECPAFMATRTQDNKKLAALALEWYGQAGDATYCVCDGCTQDVRINQFCRECGVRMCAIERGVINCATCPDYGCQKLTSLFQHIPLAQENLERIRAQL
jgi:hypothetical protein